MRTEPQHTRFWCKLGLTQFRSKNIGPDFHFPVPKDVFLAKLSVQTPDRGLYESPYWCRAWIGCVSSEVKLSDPTAQFRRVPALQNGFVVATAAYIWEEACSFGSYCEAD